MLPSKSNQPDSGYRRNDEMRTLRFEMTKVGTYKAKA